MANFFKTYHERLSIVRKMMNESNASIVGVRRRPPVLLLLREPLETEKTVAKTIAQSEMQPLIMRKRRWPGNGGGIPEKESMYLTLFA